MFGMIFSENRRLLFGIMPQHLEPQALLFATIASNLAGGAGFAASADSGGQRTKRL
jgi:hypothetical protein